MTRFQSRLTAALRRFGRAEEGTVTILMLYFTLIFVVMGGLAIDFNKAMSERTKLQMAADTAAHAALYIREDEDSSTSILSGLGAAEFLLSETDHNGAISTSDFTFGVWDNQNRTFTPDNQSRTAVQVNVAMTSERANAARNLLLGIIGFDDFDIVTASIYSTYFPPCFTEGFVAEEVVDIQSNNSFTDGFCLHSNDYVSLNSNNYFEPGTVVSMPNLDALDIPKSGFETNTGLATALRQGEYRLRLLNQLPSIIDSLRLGQAKYMPPYISGGTVKTIPSSMKVTPADFTPGSAHVMNCGGGGKLTMDPGIYSRIVFVSNCEVKFANGVHLEDAVIATTNAGPKSLNSPSDLHLGKDDNCAAGGGATLMTLGGFSAAASLNVFGGQILAIDDIVFAANADGIQGASFVSYGMIDGTSNMNMGFCDGDGMENAYRAPYFRMVN